MGSVTGSTVWSFAGVAEGFTMAAYKKVVQDGDVAGAAEFRNVDILGRSFKASLVHHGHTGIFGCAAMAVVA